MYLFNHGTASRTVVSVAWCHLWTLFSVAKTVTAAHNSAVHSLETSTLARAAVILGGVAPLAARLGTPAHVLEGLLRGEAPIPPDLFLRASEVVTEAGVAEARNTAR
jgi:hypothetical protein